MIRQLNSTERQFAAVVLVMVAVAGVAMAAMGRSDTLGVHALLVILFAGGLLYPVLSRFYEPEPTEDREASYYDDPIKVGIVLSMAYAVFGMFMACESPHSLPGRTSHSRPPGRRSDGRARPTHPGLFSASVGTPRSRSRSRQMKSSRCP